MRISILVRKTRFVLGDFDPRICSSFCVVPKSGDFTSCGNCRAGPRDFEAALTAHARALARSGDFGNNTNTLLHRARRFIGRFEPMRSQTSREADIGSRHQVYFEA